MVARKKSAELNQNNPIQDKEETVADKIWKKIEHQPIEIFALPNQTVGMHVQREPKLEQAVPDAVHITLKSAAVLPALEDALGRIRLGKDEVFEISDAGRYRAIRIVPRVY